MERACRQMPTLQTEVQIANITLSSHLGENLLRNNFREISVQKPQEELLYVVHTPYNYY